MATRSKRKNFTLLELMVCIALIAILGAVVGIKGTTLLAHHQFYSGLQTWLFDIHRVQIVAMNQGVDVVCTLKRNQQGDYQALMESDAPSFSSSTYELKQVSRLSFDGKPIEKWQVTFFSSGRISPSGLLKIEAQKENEPPVFLDFAYPIAFQTSLPKHSRVSFPPPYPEKRKG